MKLNKLKHREKESEKEKGERILEKEVSKESESKSGRENKNGKIREDEKEEKLRLAFERARKNYQREKEEISDILANARKVLGGYLRSTSEDFPSFQGVRARYEEASTDYENYRIKTRKDQKEKSSLKKLKNEEEKLKNYNHPNKPEQNSQTSSKIYTKDKKESFAIA
ncbi:MAG TPA: hypothetical protein ENL05_00340 [Candidatus Moranbacteria bacterium]|nr:hypothetical protein [Candidatus Moranbacteria bacterium]